MSQFVGKTNKDHRRQAQQMEFKKAFELTLFDGITKNIREDQPKQKNTVQDEQKPFQLDHGGLVIVEKKKGL